MKYANKQRSKQSACRRAMNKEKKEIRMLHEKVSMSNFTSNEKINDMYNKYLRRELSYDNLDADGKKLYDSCKKYDMWNKYLKLKKLENEREYIGMLLDDVPDGDAEDEYVKQYKKEYKNLGKKYNELIKSLTETSEDKKLFNLCKGIDNVQF
jgi:hypothetical protein